MQYNMSVPFALVSAMTCVTSLHAYRECVFTLHRTTCNVAMPHAATELKKRKKEMPHAATRRNIIRMAGVRKVLTTPVLI